MEARFYQTKIKGPVEAALRVPRHFSKSCLVGSIVLSSPSEIFNGGWPENLTTGARCLDGSSCLSSCQRRSTRGSGNDGRLNIESLTLSLFDAQYIETDLRVELPCDPGLAKKVSGRLN